jgi:hypothetical protein
MTADTHFERLLLKGVVVQARKAGAVILKGWAIKTGRTWKFHYGEFYWWGRVENTWHATAKGWAAWQRERRAA